MPCLFREVAAKSQRSSVARTLLLLFGPETHCRRGVTQPALPPWSNGAVSFPWDSAQKREVRKGELAKGQRRLDAFYVKPEGKNAKQHHLHC